MSFLSFHCIAIPLCASVKRKSALFTPCHHRQHKYQNQEHTHPFCLWKIKKILYTPWIYTWNYLMELYIRSQWNENESVKCEKSFCEKWRNPAIYIGKNDETWRQSSSIDGKRSRLRHMFVCMFIFLLLSFCSLFIDCLIVRFVNPVNQELVTRLIHTLPVWIVLGKSVTN